jgi:peptide deformylase
MIPHSMVRLPGILETNAFFACLIAHQWNHLDGTLVRHISRRRSQDSNEE